MYRDQGLILFAADTDSAVWLVRRLMPDLGADDRVVVTAPAFAQAKRVYEALERDWYGGFKDRAESPVPKHAGPRRDIDQCSMTTAAGGKVLFKPAGNGGKVAASRPTALVVVHPELLAAEPYRVMVAGVTAGPYAELALTDCGVPPAGWSCTRGAGHDGPCAARPAPGPDGPYRHRLVVEDHGQRVEKEWEAPSPAGLADLIERTNG